MYVVHTNRCCWILVYGCLDPYHDMVSQYSSLIRYMVLGMQLRSGNVNQGVLNFYGTINSSTSFLYIMALAVQPWLALCEQEYHQVFRSREELFFVNLNILWVINTPSLELFPENNNVRT